MMILGIFLGFILCFLFLIVCYKFYLRGCEEGKKQIEKEEVNK